MGSLAKYVKETAWALAAKGSAFVFYYALVFYLTRRMTVDRWGDWSAFLAVLNVILLASDQGINSASKRFIAQARDRAELAGVVRGTFALRVVASVCYAAVAVFVAGPALNWLGQDANMGLLQRSLVLVAFYGIAEYFKNLFEALHRLRFTFIVNTLEHALKLTLVVFLFRADNGFKAIVDAFTVALAVAAASGLLFAWRLIPQIGAAAIPKGLVASAYRYSLPVFILSIGGLVALEIDTIMLRHLRSAYETGVYSAAKNMVMFLPHVSLAVSMGTIPALSVFDAGTMVAKRRIYYEVLVAVAALYIAISFALAVFARFGVTTFFPTEYAAASQPLLVLIPFVIFSGVSIYCGNFLDYRGLAWVRSANFVLTIIANIGLNLWWIPRFGAVGAAAASSVSWAPYCAFNLWQAHKAFAVVPARPGLL